MKTAYRANKFAKRRWVSVEFWGRKQTEQSNICQKRVQVPATSS